MKPLYQLPKLEAVVIAGMAFLLVLVIGFRLISLIVIVVPMLLYLFNVLEPKPVLAVAVYALCFLTFFLPFDFSVAGFLATVYGSPKHHVQWIRCAGTCQTAHSELSKKYGVYATHPAGTGGFIWVRWVLMIQ